MTALPLDWSMMKLAEILAPQSTKKLLQQGWSPRCHPHPAEGGAWGVLKTTAIQPGWFDDRHNKTLPTSLAPKPAIEVLPGDLLITCAGPRSRCGVPTLVRRTRPRLMMSGKMYRFRPKPFVDPRFLEAWLLSPMAQKLIDQMKTGISDSGLNLTHSRFLELPVPVPPLEHQLRIVAVLEDQLSRLQAAEHYLQAAERRSLSWQESWLADRMGEPTEGEMRRVRDVLLESRGGWSRSQKHLVAPSSGVPYIKMNNITRRGEFDLQDLVFVEAGPNERARYEIRVGDVLFNSKNSGDLVGKTAVADQPVAGAVFNENIMRLRFNDEMDPTYVGVWFLSPKFRAAVIRAASASTNVAAVYRHHLVEFPIWVPNTQTQRRLGEEFEQVRVSAQQLAGAGQDARRRATGLRSALLAAAFAGQLDQPLPSAASEGTKVCV